MVQKRKTADTEQSAYVVTHVEIEQSFLKKKLKIITAYYGDLILDGAEEENS